MELFRYTFTRVENKIVTCYKLKLELRAKKPHVRVSIAEGAFTRSWSLNLLACHYVPRREVTVLNRRFVRGFICDLSPRPFAITHSLSGSFLSTSAVEPHHSCTGLGLSLLAPAKGLNSALGYRIVSFRLRISRQLSWKHLHLAFVYRTRQPSCDIST